MLNKIYAKKADPVRRRPRVVSVFTLINDNRVVEKFNGSFVNYKVAREDTSSSAGLIRDYRIFRFPSLVFLDPKGGMLFSEIAILSRPEALLLMAEKAVSLSKQKSLVDYDSEYKSGHVERNFLREYIERRQTAGITGNAELIEKYVSQLTIQDLHNYGEVLFILKAGPLADSTAYKLAQTNRKIVDSIFRFEPLQVRVAMNNATIANTMNSAIALKNVSRAFAAANFTRNTWTTDRQQGQKNWEAKMLQYYAGVKDTMNYLNMASIYYDRYFMQLSADSLRKKDSLNSETARIRNTPDSIRVYNAQSTYTSTGSRSNGNNKGIRTPVKSDTLRRRVVLFAGDVHATELNNAAWTFYQIGSTKPDFLMKALSWSRRSLEIIEKAAFYDTYAHLLYKLKLYSEAESMQKKAIEFAKKEKANTKPFESEYNKIKNKSL
ncbi:MAG: hypothetical protein EOO04_27315 [Chitinophagaceae bacterium]|nr:MAG: hypothetical protein EOO04_27315 [Chitinophagaceae bacterium]